MIVWTIAGEAGKAWDATAQVLEYRKVSGAQVSFRSLSADVLSIRIDSENLTSYTPPDLGQRIDLYRSGTRFFSGTVTDVKASGNEALTVLVSGPWWWLERINYVTNQTDGTGTAAARLTGVFGTTASGVNLKTAIETAIDTAVTLGVPIANIAGGSTVATYFDIPRITLNQSTCSDVLTELIRIVPDTMAYFDYAPTTPTFHVTRRGVATTRSLTLGTDPVESFDINPVFEMKVEQVVLPYVERDALGRTKFSTQNSGTAAAGRIQVITQSGPELDTFLPNDLFERAVITTTSDKTEFAFFGERQFDAARELGFEQSDLYVGPYNWNYSNTISQFGFVTLDSTLQIPAPALVDAEGNAVSAAGKFYTNAENLPTWAIEQYGLTPVTLSGIYGVDWLTQKKVAGSWDLKTVPIYFSVLNAVFNRKGYKTDGGYYELLLGTFSAPGYLSATNYHTAGTARTGSGATTIVLATTASSVDDFYVGLTVTWNKSGVFITDTITDYVGSTRAATLTTTWGVSQRPASGNTYKLQGHPLYQEADYSFIAPPANFASNLLASQNFTPYEGQITLVEDTAGGTRYRGCKVNVSGSLPALSTMGALVAAETIDIGTGITTIDLGTPPRLDYRSLVDRIRKTPQDNIVFS
jgi:hypothetical protein